MLALESRIANAERMLREDFVAMVGDLSLADIAVRYIPPVGVEVHAEPLQSFSLCALVGEQEEDCDPSSFVAAAYDYQIVDPPTPVKKHCACLDTGYAMGFVFGERLAAYAAGGITYKGKLRVQQIQGGAPDSADPIGARGRRAGLRWGDTLVEGWAVIGQRLGLDTIEILPGEKNEWLRPKEPKRNERIIRHYTTTALRCGFDRNDPTEIWRRSLVI